MEYFPDLWTVLELTNPAGEKHFRILGSWYGGYGGSDSWKMSSGITKIEEDERGYRVHNDSGSIYNCAKGSEGASGYAFSEFQRYQKLMREAGGDIIELASLAHVKL